MQAGRAQEYGYLGTTATFNTAETSSGSEIQCWAILVWDNTYMWESNLLLKILHDLRDISGTEDCTLLTSLFGTGLRATWDNLNFQPGPGEQVCHSFDE